MISLLLAVCISLLLSGCNLQNNPGVTPVTITPTPTPISQAASPSPSTIDSNYEKMCAWVDKSDIIIELQFADGVTKDTSYEAGFAYTTTKSTLELKEARLARSQCNYRVGFNKTDVEKLSRATIAVWGYTDSNRRMLEKEPISIEFVNGISNRPSPIIVKVLN